MANVENLTVEDYIEIIDDWFKKSKLLPINQWNIFDRARRWLW